VEALARSEPQAALITVCRAVVLEAHARLECCQDADEALLHGVLGEELPGELLLVDYGRVQVTDGSVKLAGLGERRLLEALGGGEDEVLEVEQTNSGVLEKEKHASLAEKPRQVAAEDQPVEPGKNGGDEGAVTRYESLHGVLLGEGVASQPPSYLRSDAVYQRSLAHRDLERCSPTAI